MANKMTVKGWDEIQSDYERMQGMSCVPAVIRKVAQNHVFDENQSVKWNRDKVAENNAAYQSGGCSSQHRQEQGERRYP